MSIFSKLLNRQEEKKPLIRPDYDKKTFVFRQLPESLEQMKALPAMIQ